MFFFTRKVMNRLLLVAALWTAGCFVPPSARGDEPSPTAFIYSFGQSKSSSPERYHWRLLEAALEKTRGTYGDYRLVMTPPMPTSRQIYELSNANPSITVAVLVANADLDHKLIPVRIPIDRGLLGYRIMLIRANDQPRFEAIRSLEDLKSVSFGLVPWWDDTAIMRRAGLTVVPGDSYDGLFHMLGAYRFDAFSRGVTEVLTDYDRMKPRIGDLAVERHLLLHYPMPVYFWFSDDEEGRRRANRVRAGLAAMVAAGELQAMFETEFRRELVLLDLASRTIIEIPNPLLGTDDPFGVPALWYKPH